MLDFINANPQKVEEHSNKHSREPDNSMTNSPRSMRFTTERRLDDIRSKFGLKFLEPISPSEIYNGFINEKEKTFYNCCIKFTFLFQKVFFTYS